MSEQTINSAIDTSVKHAFSGRNPESQAIAARNKLEQETRGGKEKLLALAKSAAKSLAKEGVMPDITNEADRRAAAAIWNTAEERAAKHLKIEAKSGNTAVVLATLNEIDRCDVPVQILNAKPGERQQRNVRRSVGLLPETKAHFHEANANAKFPDSPDSRDQLVIGGQPFRKEAVQKTLEGKGKYQPMWRENDVLIPLVSSQTGEVHFVTVKGDQLTALTTRLQEKSAAGGPNLAPSKESQPKIVKIEFGGESDVGIKRKANPDEDSYFSGARGQQPQLRLAIASDNTAAYGEEIQKRMTPDQYVELQQKLLVSQDQLGLANEFSEKIFANGVDGLFIVADGMGGGEAGDHASQRAIQKTLEKLSKTPDWTKLTPDEVQQKLKEAVLSANEFVYQIRQSQNKDLGSTLTMAMVVDGKLYTANVGDSRVYLYEEATNNITRLTQDHSLVESLVSAGEITDDERYTHPQRNQIFRSLGFENKVEVDVSGPIEINGKVKILVSCDGLWEMVRDPQLRDALAQQKPAKDIAKELIAAANANGGEDNITAIVAELSSS